MKFKLFDLNKDGKGVDPKEDKTPNLRYYFKLLWRNLSRLLSINLLAVLQFAPLLGAFLVHFWAYSAPSITDLSYPLFFGISQLDASPAIQVLAFLASPQYFLPPWISPALMLAMGACILVFVIIFGWCNVGFTYLLRELITGRPAFIFSDLKYAIKKNAKQGFVMGLLDALLLFVLGFNIANMGTGVADGFLGDFFYIANVAIALIYVIMRFYIYLMLITFDMKLSKIFKNALIFVMLGIKRNLMAILGVVLMIGLNVALFIVYMPLGIILPFFFIPIFPAFTTAYAAYPVIKKYMIDPVPAPSHEDVDEEEPSSIFDEEPMSAEELWNLFKQEVDVGDCDEFLARSFPDADHAANLILQGEKTAASLAHPLFQEKKDALPHIGGYSVVLDANGGAVCIIQTTKVYVSRFNQINEEHARMEGDSDKSLKAWTKKHRDLFSSQLQEVGLTFSDDMRVLCEEFKVVYTK